MHRIEYGEPSPLTGWVVNDWTFEAILQALGEEYGQEEAREN